MTDLNPGWSKPTPTKAPRKSDRAGAQKIARFPGLDALEKSDEAASRQMALAKMNTLTRDERMMLRYRAMGLGNPQISERMGVSVSRVKDLFTPIYTKLGLTGLGHKGDRASYVLGQWDLLIGDPPR